jgi:hypothetical protein
MAIPKSTLNAKPSTPVQPTRQIPISHRPLIARSFLGDLRTSNGVRNSSRERNGTSGAREGGKLPFPPPEPLNRYRPFGDLPFRPDLPQRTAPSVARYLCRTCFGGVVEPCSTTTMGPLALCLADIPKHRERCPNDPRQVRPPCSLVLPESQRNADALLRGPLIQGRNDFFRAARSGAAYHTDGRVHDAAHLAVRHTVIG